MKCPKCKTEFTPTPSQLAGEFGSRKSEAKTAAARANGAKGGRPKKTKREKENLEYVQRAAATDPKINLAAVIKAAKQQRKKTP